MPRAYCIVSHPLVPRVLGSAEEQAGSCLLHKQNKHLTAILALSFPLLAPEVGEWHLQCHFGGMPSLFSIKQNSGE